LPPEIQELVQSLTHTTAQLARVERGAACQMERALAERTRAIDAIRRWIAREPAAAREVSAELARQLTRDLDKGTQTLLRLAMDREVMRSDRMALDRQLQLLHGFQGACAATRKSISCRG
jgi:hypothetical protein